MKGALQESRNLRRGRGQVRNRRAGHALHSFTDRSLTLGLHPSIPGSHRGMLGIPQTAGNRWRGGGGVAVGHKGQGLLHATVPPPPSRLFLSCPMGPTKVPQTARNRRRAGAVGVGGRGQGLLRATVPPRLPAYFWGVPDPIGVPQTARNARNRRRGRGFGVGHKGQGLLRATVPPLLPAYFWGVPGARVPQTARKHPNSRTTRPTDSQTGTLARYS